MRSKNEEPQIELQAEEIHVSFGAKKVLSGVELTLRAGEILMLLGPSGGGKTTLLRCLSFLSEPDQGRVRFRGQTVIWKNGRSSVSSHKLYPTLTTVFQQLFLWPHLTTSQNITLALEKKETFYFSELKKIAEVLGIQDVMERYPNECSVGQKQRVALARALILKPKILLLDEITSALDSRSADVVGNLLKDLAEEGTAILSIAHNREFCEKFGTRMSRLENGVITGN